MNQAKILERSQLEQLDKSALIELLVVLQGQLAEQGKQIQKLSVTTNPTSSLGKGGGGVGSYNFSHCPSKHFFGYNDRHEQTQPHANPIPSTNTVALAGRGVAFAIAGRSAGNRLADDAWL